jgi:hypothetical protein
MLAKLIVKSATFWIVLKSVKNLSKALQAVIMLQKRRDTFTGTPGTARYFYANNRIFFNPNVPGFPSISYNKFVINELSSSLNSKNSHSRLTTLIFSITKKCPLRC